MNWLRNSHFRQIDASLRALSAGGRRIVKGEPNATETHTAAELAHRGYVGPHDVTEQSAMN